MCTRVVGSGGGDWIGDVHVGAVIKQTVTEDMEP